MSIPFLKKIKCILFPVPAELSFVIIKIISAKLLFVFIIKIILYIIIKII